MPSRRKRKDRTARWKVRRQTLMQQRRARSHSPKALTTSPRRPPPALLYDFLRVAAEETEARSYLDKLENIASNALWTLHLTRHEALLLKLAEADGALALRLEEAKRRAGNEEAEFQDWCGILRNYYTDELVCMQLEEGRYRRGILTEVAASVTDLFYHYNFDRPACAIQRLWRGHRERKLLPERRREHRRREAQRLLEDERKAFAVLQERIEEREASERAAVVEDELRLRRFIAGLKEDEAGPVRRRYAEWIEGRIEEILSSEEPFRQKIMLEERRQWASLSRYLWETLRDLVDYERNSLHADIIEYYREREVARQEREGLRQWRLRRHAAALQLQAWVRGCWGRQAAWALRREAEEARWRKVEVDIAAREAFVQAEFERHDRLRAEGEQRYLASIQLQRVWRGYKGRGTLHAKKFRCKMHANRQEVVETALMAEADAHSLAAVEAYVMAVTKRWAPIFLAKKVLRERRHQLMMERRAFVVRDYYAGVAWAVALLQRQWRAALARRVVWWRRANGGEQQHVLRAQQVERKHLEWEERLKWEMLQRVGHGLRCGDFTEDAAEFWAEVLEAERIQKSAQERQCRRHAAATVVQQFCRIRTSCAAVGRQHEALGRRRLAEFRAEEAARPVREREWRRLAASAVQRVFRGFQCRQALPYGVRELMVVTRAAEVQRRLDVDAEIVAWKSLLAMDERQRRHLRLAVVAEERRRWVSVLRVQRWYRRLRSVPSSATFERQTKPSRRSWQPLLRVQASFAAGYANPLQSRLAPGDNLAWRDRQLEQLLEELHLVDRSEALQRRSLQRSEDAQRRDLLSLFEETRPISLADSLQRSLDARRLRMELEKQSLFAAAPPSPAAGDASSEWTMSKWKFEKRPQVTADELAVAAARASTPPNFSVF